METPLPTPFNATIKIWLLSAFLGLPLGIITQFILISTGATQESVFKFHDPLNLIGTCVFVPLVLAVFFVPHALLLYIALKTIQPRYQQTGTNFLYTVLVVVSLLVGMPLLLHFWYVGQPDLMYLEVGAPSLAAAWLAVLWTYRWSIPPESKKREEKTTGASDADP